MPIGALEYARVWNTLDPNLREKVRKGEMSIEEASSYVVPIGDLELARARELPQGVGAVTPQQPLDAVGDAWNDGTVAQSPNPAPRNSSSDEIKRGIIGLEGFLPTILEGLALSEMEAADRATAIREGRAEAFNSQPYKDAFGEAQNNAGTRVGVTPVSAGYAAVGLGLDALNIGVSQISDKLNATFRSDADIQAKRQRAEQVAFEQVEALTQVSRELAKLPPNLASQEFQDAVDSGNYFTAAQLAPSAAYYVSLQNAPTLAAQAAISAATAAITKNPTAIRTVMGATGAVGESSEISNDYMDVLSRLSPEEQADPLARFAAFKTAAKSTMARMAVGAVVPAGLGRGTGNIARDVAQVTGLNVAQEMGGEAIASDIRGADYTAGSLLLEGLGGLGGGVAEGGGMVWNDYREGKLTADLTKTLQQQADEAVASLDTLTAKREAAQRLAEANREVFDAELESDRMMEELRAKKAEADSLNNATQTEMPFGSDLTPGENDRTPTIVDMFSGESTPAVKAQATLSQRVDEPFRRFGEDAMDAAIRNPDRLNPYLPQRSPEETDEAFEIRKQRETVARDKIDNRKQSDFEAEQQRRESKRALEAEDQTILKNERTLQSTADISREAQRRLEMEKNDIRRRPENRRGIRNAKLGETLEAYERKRKPELIAEVREERLARINEARNRTIERENARTELADIDVQAELDARSTERLTKEREAERPLTDDLFGTPEAEGQMELLPGQITNQPNRPTYTGELTEEEAVREAASLTLKRQRALEQTRPQEAKKAQAAEVGEAEEMARAIDAEMPSIQAALDKQKTAKTNLTVKKYADAEKKAQKDIIKEELEKPDATEESVKVAAATRMAEWRKANPPPAAAPAPATADGRNLVQLAEKAKSDQDKAAKTRETKKLRQALKNEMASGKTPEEAAAAVRDRVLSKQEDADVRAELGGATTRSPSTASTLRRRAADSMRNTEGQLTWVESAGIREELDKILASKSRTKPGDLLRAVIAHKDSSAGEKWLANKLVGLVDNLDIRLVEVPKNDPESANWGGAFNPTENSLWIRVATSETVLHEVLHAVTSNLISSKIMRGNPKIKSAVSQLNDVLEAARAAYAQDQAAITGRLATLLAGKQGPLSNTTELVSYALTDDSVMEWLQSVPMPGKKKTAWQGFKDAIKTIFRPRNEEQNNALDEILEATSSLTEIQETSPVLNAAATREIRDRAGFGFTTPTANPSDAGDVEVATEEKFTNPVAKRKFWGPGGKLRPELKLKGTWVEAIADAVSAGGGSLDYAKGMRSAITEVFERSGSETGSLIAEAEGLFKAMEISLRKQARRTKQDPEAVRAQFSRDVEQLETMAPGLTKTQKAVEFADKYGNAARGYFAARAKIDSLSNEILQQRLSDPRPFTAEEAGVYRSIKENVGRYYSRVYAASTKGIGSRRAKRLVDEYERFIEKAGLDDKDGYEIVKNAIQYVSKNHLIVPDDDGLADMSLQELSDMADAWGIKVIAEADMDNPLTAEINRESLTEQLVQFRDATPEARQRQARVLVEELLFSRKHAALNKFYRGQAQNRTIVEERKIVPPEIRKLLGEYEDIPLKAMTTLIRMATFRSNTKVFNELLERTGGTTILTPQEAADKDISPEEWKQLPKSLSYGPLAGMWVRKDILPRIESTVEISNTFDQLIGQGEEGISALVTEGGKWAIEKWMGFAATVKMMQLVLNIANAGLNYGGGPVALVSNGNFSPSSVRKAHDIAISLVASQASSHMTPDMLKVIRAGITDNAMMGSIRKVEAEKLEDVLFSHLESKGEKLYSRGKRKAAASGRLWRETYAMADVVWKIANFPEEERKLTEYYKAEGTDMSAEAIEREAAWRTNQTNFSYKRVPNWLKAVEKGGVTYVMPYVYETFRAPAASLMLGIADLNKASKSKTPKGKQLMLMSGIKRTGGALLAMGAMQMAMHAGAQMLAEALGGEDDEWTKKLRVFMPDYKKFADLIYLGRTAEGKPVILEFSRFDPFGPSTEFFRMAVAGAEPEEYMDAIGNLIIGNPYGRGIVQSLIGQGGTNTRMQEMTPDIYAGLVDAFTRMGMSGTRQAKAIDLLLPSAIVRPFDPNNAPVEGDFSTWLFTSAGGQLHNVDPNKAVEFAVNDYSRNMENITDSFRTVLKTQETTDESLLSKLSQLREDEKDNFRKLQGLYDGMIELGYTPQEVLAQLQQRRVPKNTLAMLGMGGYIPEGSGIVSVRGLTQSWEAVNGSSVGVERKQRYYDNIVRTLRLVESGQIPAKE